MKMFTVTKGSAFHDEQEFEFADPGPSAREDKGTVVWDILEFVPNGTAMEPEEDTVRTDICIADPVVSEDAAMFVDDWGML